MSSGVCFDAGVIYLYYQKNPPQKIDELMQDIKEKKLTGFISSVILVEVYKHLCVSEGKDYADSCIRSFLNNLRPQLVDLTPELILRAGQLKCQYRNKLSYNDSIIIAISLDKKATLHTTEKELPEIKGLKSVKYDF